MSTPIPPRCPTCNKPLEKLQSQRADGRGHRPKGYSGPPLRPPSGWEDTGLFLRAFWGWAKVKGLSAYQLAQSLGVHPTSIYGWKTGRHRPSQQHVDAMYDLLKDHLRADHTQHLDRLAAVPGGDHRESRRPG